MRYLGIDIHKKYCEVAEVCSDSSKPKNYRFQLTEEGISKFLISLDNDCQAVIEATSNSFFLYDKIQPLVSRILVANPLQLKAIASARIKTDKVDAKVLARLLKADFIPSVWVPDKFTRDLRRLLHHRISLNKTSTTLKNQIHSILGKNNINFNGEDLFSNKGRGFLSKLELSRLDKIILSSSMTLLKNLEEEIKKLSCEIANLAKNSPYTEDVKTLMSIAGIDYYSSLIILSEIGDIRRFLSPKHLASYSGLVPRVYSSGQVHRTGRITKQGRRSLRWIMIQISNQVTKSSGNLRNFYLRLKNKKGHNVAIVAVARKFLTIIWKLLTVKKEYYDKREDLFNKKLIKMNRLANPYPVIQIQGERLAEFLEEDFIIRDSVEEEHGFLIRATL